jgi:hypothetical protein
VNASPEDRLQGMRDSLTTWKEDSPEDDQGFGSRTLAFKVGLSSSTYPSTVLNKPSGGLLWWDPLGLTTSHFTISEPFLSMNRFSI